MTVPEDEEDKLTDFKYEDDDASLPLKDSEKMSVTNVDVKNNDNEEVRTIINF